VDISNQLDKTCDVLRDEFGSKSVLSMPCDVTDDKSLRGVFEKTIDEFGSLDIVVNNAGIDNEQNWSKTIQVNLSAVIAGTYHALELMSPGGVIINVSSMAGLYPIPFGPTYSATKHGVVGFSRSMKDHDEIRKKNIRINVLCPYFAEVGMGQNSFDQIPEPYRSEIAKKGFVTFKGELP
jgi:15-hydroxyprostaglandin dehydrogenase (NAD)